ncbi:alpha/beta family hydrolase [Paraglaciecola aquimarina]|uniref:Alpha/beta family hydrolase n=1 Tax=Paraglaciecola aquimarina TaxID=1235557 RepID=A0ABU3SXZ4_9ALTE|nr:alpha/beta family hydrolase [Paraglaciecola aquimarina]MDU0354878.1 alpha/beta family hydrolase [Paraglaciecola aquimarina]
MIRTLFNPAQSTEGDEPLATFVFAHGAGAGQDSEFMQYMAQRLSAHNINVLRFNFAYMQLATELGKRRPPDRANKLLAHFQQVLAELDTHLPVFIGGKSMGGRMASMLLEQSQARGCICMGYPFHPPGKPEKLRTEHLVTISKPVLILQGERDTFGTRQEVSQYTLSEHVSVSTLADGDHSFKPRKASGYTLEQNLQSAVKQSVKFIQLGATTKIAD